MWLSRQRVCWILCVCVCLGGSHAWAVSTGEVELRVVDAADGQPIPVRMHLKDQNGKPVKVPKTVAWHDHFIVPGRIVLELKAGHYTFEMEHGPEYKLRTGHFTLERGAADSKTIEMNRFVDMKKEGWYSGDLNIHRKPDDISLLMRAEDLYIGPVVTWTNKVNDWKEKPLPADPVVKVDGGRFANLLAGEDQRIAATVLFFNLDKPLPIFGAAPEFPSSAAFVEQAKASGAAAHVDLENPFSWDLPMLLATGQIDSIGVHHGNFQRDGQTLNDTSGKPRDKSLYPDPEGLGRYSLDVYYHLLNCGLRIPPSAGSASGIAPNPVGYNRVYVHCGEEFSYENWFAGLKAGRVTVTNGPMLRPLVNGQLPGHIFQAEKDETVELTVALNLSLREKVDYLEIVQDGKVVNEVRLDEFAKQGGMLPPVVFKRSGWMLVRAVTKHPKTFRFAMTGPYYVEIGYEKQISKKSAQFFLDWVYERARRLPMEPADDRTAALVYHKAARDFWQKLVDSANAE